MLISLFSHFLFSFTSKDPKKRGRTDYCSSKSGRVGGAQAVTLGNSCLTTGTEEEIVGRIQHEILHAVGSLHEMNRPDRDSHISIDPRKYRARGLSHRDFEKWKIGAGKFSEKELARLTTSFDIMSIQHYRPHWGITALNPYYNEVGFGDNYTMTATDKVALNIFLSCPAIKKEIYEEFKVEEYDRNYIELMQLSITPDEKSQR